GNLPPYGFLPTSTIGDRLRIIFHAIRNNKARFFSTSCKGALLDSHTDNVNFQSQRITPVLQDIANFITLLKKHRNQFGSLFDQTTIFIGSELGRFPKFNLAKGKDHWPENSWILCGKGIKREEGGATIGETDPVF